MNAEITIANPFQDDLLYDFYLKLSCGQQGKIEFSFFSKNKGIEISVVDTGCGIPSEKLKTVFEAFSQHYKKDRLYKGTGIGLSITKEICSLLNYDITVQSEIDKGSEFKIFIRFSVNFTYQI